MSVYLFIYYTTLYTTPHNTTQTKYYPPLLHVHPPYVQSLAGLSVRSVVSELFSQMIVFLFLVDSDTSLLVTVPAFFGIIIQMWKVCIISINLYSYSLLYFYSLIAIIHMHDMLQFLAQKCNDYYFLIFLFCLLLTSANILFIMYVTFALQSRLFKLFQI